MALPLAANERMRGDELLSDPCTRYRRRMRARTSCALCSVAICCRASWGGICVPRSRDVRQWKRRVGGAVSCRKLTHALPMLWGLRMLGTTALPSVCMSAAGEACHVDGDAVHARFTSTSCARGARSELDGLFLACRAVAAWYRQCIAIIITGHIDQYVVVGVYNVLHCRATSKFDGSVALMPMELSPLHPINGAHDGQYTSHKRPRSLLRQFKALNWQPSHQNYRSSRR